MYYGIRPRVSLKGLVPPANFQKVGHIYLHPQDLPDFYPSIIFQVDPNTYVPQPEDAFSLEVYDWGLKEHTSPDIASFIQSMIKHRHSNNNRVELYKDYPDPIDQFLDPTIERKLQFIRTNEEIQEACANLSLTIRVTLYFCGEDCWRLFRVPASTSLAVLFDKILCPVMGWRRGYHGYVFRDFTDGAVIGPRNHPGYIDMMHMRLHFLQLMDDSEIPVAALLRKVDDECCFIYDLGDRWRHLLEVMAVTNLDGGESVELLDGGGACPPEDSIGLNGKDGNYGYAEFLEAYKENPNSKEVKKVIREVETKAANYKQHWSGSGLPFKPLDFDITLHRTELACDLLSPRFQKTAPHLPPTLNASQCARCTDNLKPLLTCSSCKKVKYCSRDCQKAHWKEHKKVCNKK